MIQLENSKHIVIIEDDFVEAIIKVAQGWRERINGDIEELIIKEVAAQMEDDTKYISIKFEVDNATAIRLDLWGISLSFIISKENVTLRTKWKKVRIKKDSPYERLNDNPKFIAALTKKYNTDYDVHVYYLPVMYESTLWCKSGKVQTPMCLTVDIPFSDIEVCE